MAKGKFGLSPAAVAVIAFGFCALRQPQSVLLVTGFALLAEKDQWLNRQAMQALLLTIVYYLADLVAGWIFGGLAWLVGELDLYSAAIAMTRINTFVSGLLSLALMVFSVLAVLRVYRGRDAGLPLMTKILEGDFTGAPLSAPAAAATLAEVPEASPRPSPVTIPSTTAVAPSIPAPQPLVRRCPACSAPLVEGSKFCTECGSRVE